MIYDSIDTNNKIPDNIESENIESCINNVNNIKNNTIFKDTKELFNSDNKYKYIVSKEFIKNNIGVTSVDFYNLKEKLDYTIKLKNKYVKEKYDKDPINKYNLPKSFSGITITI